MVYFTTKESANDCMQSLLRSNIWDRDLNIDFYRTFEGRNKSQNDKQIEQLNSLFGGMLNFDQPSQNQGM